MLSVSAREGGSQCTPSVYNWYLKSRNWRKYYTI